MVTCVAYGCKNRTGKSEVTFHKFPADSKRRALWVSALQRDNWQPSNYSRLCSAHFQERDFDRTSLSCVRLREFAVPSNFPALPPHVRKIKQEIVDPVWNSQEFVDDMTVKTEVDEVMSVDMSLKSEVKVEDHDVDDGCGEEENDGVDEDFSVDMSLKSEVKVEDHNVDDGCGEEVNDVDEEIKLPEAVFIKEELDWEAEEEDEESFSLCGENFNEGKDGNSGLLGGVRPATDLSSEKSMNCSIGRSLCTCTCFLIGEGNEAALNPLLWNARGKLPKRQTCEKCSVHHISNDPEETSTNHKLFTMRKTSTQRSREYRERKRLSVILPKLPPKTGAERAREFRERRRALQKAASAGDFIIEPKIKISTSPIKMPKTSTQRSRECRERKRGKRSPKQPPKSSAQRVREYRERQKALKNAATSVVKFRSSFYTS